MLGIGVYKSAHKNIRVYTFMYINIHQMISKKIVSVALCKYVKIKIPSLAYYFCLYY